MEGSFVSYAQNGEDVLLWRALGHIKNGRYVDVGAADPDELSVTKAFYERGWRGVDVEPTPEYAEALRAARPEDLVIEAAVTAQGGDSLRFHEIRRAGGQELTGLSTLVGDVAAMHDGGEFVTTEREVAVTTLAEVCGSDPMRGEIHFLKIDVEGAEADVLRSMDFERHRPWVVVVEATKPLSTEPTYEEWDPILVEANYEFVLFDGLSRYYVAAERSELAKDLSYPVCVFDEFVTAERARVDADMEAAREHIDAVELEARGLWQDVIHWRAVALDALAEVALERERSKLQLRRVRARLRARIAERSREAAELRAQVKRMESSASWRVTRPLRGVRSRLGTTSPR